MKMQATAAPSQVICEAEEAIQLEEEVRNMLVFMTELTGSTRSHGETLETCWCS